MDNQLAEMPSKPVHKENTKYIIEGIMSSNTYSKVSLLKFRSSSRTKIMYS